MISWLQSLRVQLIGVAIVLVLVLIALALAPDAARAGRYTVVQCDRSNRAYADAQFERRNPGDYAFAFRCEEDEDASSLQIHTLTGTPANRFGRIFWAAPATTRIMGVSGEARLRNDAGHQARLSFLDVAGNEVGRIATGKDSPSGFERFERQLSDGGRDRFAASLACAAPGGCAATSQARTWIRSVRLTIDDRTPPVAFVAGGITEPGWQRGSRGLVVTAGDFGSGIRRIDVAVNGHPAAPSQSFACATLPGSALVTRTQPCQLTRADSAIYDTRVGPFINGTNRITACAHDYGDAGVPGCVERVVAVDNAPPELAFVNDRDPEEPELIRATIADRHSGVASASIAFRPLDGGAWKELHTARSGSELRATVDSSAEPPGRYLFRVSGGDVAGNSASSTQRADGSQMILTFPLREATHLDASIEGDDSAVVDYGRTPALEGALRAADGTPIAGKPVDVLETFAAGSSLDPIGRTVVTDARGRISLPLSRGPSRSIAVAFAGTHRYLPAEPRQLGLTVRSTATLAMLKRRVRAGRKALFHGSVGTYGAILPGGKLVELQVKGGGIRRFRTVRQAFRTDPRGNWSLRYGFDRFYERPTRFRFRLKVAQEGGWPYLAPAVSRSKKLVVVPRRGG